MPIRTQHRLVCCVVQRRDVLGLHRQLLHASLGELRVAVVLFHVVDPPWLVFLPIQRQHLDMTHCIALVAQGLVGERAVNLRWQLDTQGTGDQAEGRVVFARAFAMQLRVAFQAQVILAFQAKTQRHYPTVHTEHLARSQFVEIKLHVVLDLGGPVRHHLAVLGHVALQHLVAGVDERHVDILLASIGLRKGLQLSLAVPHHAALSLDIKSKDICHPGHVGGRDQGIMVMFRLDPGRLIAPQQTVAAHLHHLLSGGLAAEVPELPEVVVEGMLPGNLARVGAKVAHDTANALVTGPGLGQLGLHHGLHQPQHRRVLGIDAQIVGPVLQAGHGLTHQGWKLLELHQRLLRQRIIDSEEDKGIGVQVFQRLLAQNGALLEVGQHQGPKVVQILVPAIAETVQGRNHLLLCLPTDLELRPYGQAILIASKARLQEQGLPLIQEHAGVETHGDISPGDFEICPLMEVAEQFRLILRGRLPGIPEADDLVLGDDLSLGNVCIDGGLCSCHGAR
mmetsp:Transcript_60346/g.95610  ORF Transcript_60346/g.95610 Transcript_60346/m.95610 type:complete len:508 (+) Transcript_60346:414-1937(+)